MYKKLGDYIVDQSNKVVIKDGEEIDIEPIVYDVLDYLISHCETYTSITDLHDNIWVNKIVSDSAVRRTIVKIRNLFGDSSADPLYLKSKARSGYKLICEITDYHPPEINLPSPEQSFIRSSKSFWILIILASILIFFIISNYVVQVPNLISEKKELSLQNIPIELNIYGQNSDPNLSMSGDLLTFSNKMEKHFSHTLFVVNLKTGTTTQISSINRDIIKPIWVEDDTAIIAMELTKESCHLIKITNPLDEAERKTESLHMCKSGQPNINYDSKNNRIIFSDNSEDYEPLSLFSFSLESHSIKKLTTPTKKGIGDYFSAISEHSEMLAYVRNEHGHNSINIENTILDTFIKKIELQEDVYNIFWDKHATLYVLVKGALLSYDKEGEFLSRTELPSEITDITSSGKLGEFIIFEHEPYKYILVEQNNPLIQLDQNLRIIAQSEKPITFTYASSEQDIFYTIEKDGLTHIYLLSGSVKENIYSSPNPIKLIGGSVHKKRLIFEEDSQYGIIDLENESMKYFNKINEVLSNLSISFDGQRLLYSKREFGVWNLYQYNLETQVETFITNNILNGLDIGENILGQYDDNSLVILQKTRKEQVKLKDKFQITLNNNWHYIQGKIFYSSQIQDLIEIKSYDPLTKKHQKATMEQGSYNAKFDINVNAKSLIHLYRPIDQTEILLLKI